MKYIDKSQLPGEHVIYRTTLHWIVFMKPACWALAAMVFFCNGQTVQTGMICLVFAVVIAMGSLVKYMSSEMGITTKRLILKDGLIRIRSFEMMLDKVEGVQIEQNLIGRVLDYGSVTVIGTGGTKELFQPIANPSLFRKIAETEISDFRLP